MNITLRGAPLELWTHLRRAIHEGIEPPMEWVSAGVTGSGKSWGDLAAIIRLASIFPNVPGRVLVARLTRRSLTTTTCVTMRKILPPSHPMFAGARDESRTGYRLGAWEFVLTGIDNIDNLLGAEWDFVFVDELRQFPLSAWEDIQIRALRNYALYRYDVNGDLAAPGQGVCPIPFGMSIGATNPGKRKHWIKTRAANGKLTLVESWAHDNPYYYDLDEERNELVPTLPGQVFLRRCEQYTGVRYKRMVKGIWCNADGAIFEDWEDDLDLPESQRNLVRLPRDTEGWVTPEAIKALDIRGFYAGVDFGDDAPGCIVVAGYTGKRKLIVVAEAYARKKKLDWWAATVARIHAHYPITLGWCDHGWGGTTFVDAFNDAVGAEQNGPGQVFVLAHKQDRDRSIALMQMRIAQRTLVYDIDALIHPPDATLVEGSLPTCTADEIPDYVHKRESDEDEVQSGEKAIDEPDPKCHDHGVSASYYLVRGLDHFEPADGLPEVVSPLAKRRALAMARLMRQPWDEMLDEEDGVNEEADALRRAVWGARD